jgi:ABC-2 type transport system permease protein
VSTMRPGFLRRLAILELKQLFHGRAVTAGLVLLLGAGAFGVYHGQRVVERQRAALAVSPALQHEQHQSILGPLPATARAGDQLYYLFFHTAHEPSEWAAFSIGQRDVQAFNLKVRLLALHGQLYNTDLANPLLAAFGNFDVAFVIVLLAPLLIIALTHNVWSSERELGTWDLICSQPTSPFRVLLIKLLVRTLVAVMPVAVVLIGAVWWLGVPVDVRVLHASVLTALYMGVWVGLSALIVSAGRSSDFTVVTLLGAWILWSVLAPSLIAVAGAARFPLPEALELTVRQRQGYHASWDRPVRETMERFYRRYPEWAAVTVPEDTYSNAWYYAMQQAGDDEAQPAADAYFETLERRRQWTTRAALLFPPAALQLAFNDLARTDLLSHIGYLRSVGAYHEQLKAFFFPAVFDDRPLAAVHWRQAPVHGYRDTRAFTGAFGLHGASLAVSAAVLLVAGLARLRARTPPAARAARPPRGRA